VLFGFNDSYFVIGDIAPQISSTITARKNRNCEIAGVKQIRIHDFRHSYAFLLIYKGANIITVSKFLGHTKIEETLNTYSHMFSTALDYVVSVIDSLEDE
jgi:integrase